MDGNLARLVLLLILGTLATYRLGVALAREEGPLALFSGFRNLFLKDNWIGRGVRCFNCVSFWVALLLALPLAEPGMPVFLIWWGMAGGALVLDKYWTR